MTYILCFCMIQTETLVFSAYIFASVLSDCIGKFLCWCLALDESDILR